MRQDDDVLQQQLKDLREYWEQMAEFHRRRAGRRMGVRLRQKLQARQLAWERAQRLFYLVRLWTSRILLWTGQILIALARWIDPTSSSQEAVNQKEDRVIDSTCRPVEPQHKRGRPRRRRKDRPTVYTVVGEAHESNGLE
jgi:hypothetical protein